MLNALSRNWWATALRGLLAIGVGILAWARPEIFWASLVLVFAVYAVVDGLFAIAAAITGGILPIVRCTFSRASSASPWV